MIISKRSGYGKLCASCSLKGACEFMQQQAAHWNAQGRSFEEVCIRPRTRSPQLWVPNAAAIEVRAFGC